MRYERKEVVVPFGERHIIIETEEERVLFNRMIQEACVYHSIDKNTDLYTFVAGIRRDR